jgi:hypothetical protein
MQWPNTTVSRRIKVLKIIKGARNDGLPKFVVVDGGYVWTTDDDKSDRGVRKAGFY